MRFLSSYSLIKESVAQAKSLWNKEYPGLENIFLDHFKELFKKNPGYLGGFFSIFLKSLVKTYPFDQSTIDEIKNGELKLRRIFYVLGENANPEYEFNFVTMNRCYDLLVKYKQLFSGIDLTSYENLETLSDYLNNTIINNDRMKLIKSFLSSKYFHLIDNDTPKLFEDCYKLINDRDKFNSLILTKIAAIRSSEEFNSMLMSYIKNNGEWSVGRLEQKSIDAGANIIFKDSDVLIVETPTWECLKQLGSKNWCIVREEHFWKQYLIRSNIKINNQYIIFDTSKSTSDNLSMIGITITPSNSVRAAHVLNDDAAKNENYSKWREYLAPIDAKELVDKIENIKDVIDLDLVVPYLEYKVTDVMNFIHYLKSMKYEFTLSFFTNNKVKDLFEDTVKLNQDSRIVFYGDIIIDNNETVKYSVDIIIKRLKRESDIINFFECYSHRGYVWNRNNHYYLTLQDLKQNSLVFDYFNKNIVLDKISEFSILLGDKTKRLTQELLEYAIEHKSYLVEDKLEEMSEMSVLFNIPSIDDDKLLTNYSTSYKSMYNYITNLYNIGYTKEDYKDFVCIKEAKDIYNVFANKYLNKHIKDVDINDVRVLNETLNNLKYNCDAIYMFDLIEPLKKLFSYIHNNFAHRFSYDPKNSIESEKMELYTDIQSHIIPLITKIKQTEEVYENWDRI